MPKRFFTPHEEILKPLHVKQEREKAIRSLAEQKAKDILGGKKTPTDEQINDMYRFVNILNPNELLDIVNMSEGYTVLLGPLKNKFKTNDDMFVEYNRTKDLGANFINHFLTMGKKYFYPTYQTSQELIENTIKLDKAIQMHFMPFRSAVTIDEVSDAFDYFMNAIKPGGAGFLNFDFETLSGMKNDRVKSFDTITEFSFLESAGVGTAKEMKEKTRGYLIGIDDKLAKYYASIFNNGMSLNPDNYTDVVARRLAMYGNKATKYSISKNGAYVIDQLGELPENYQPLKEDIMRGIKLLNKAYHADQDTLDTATGLTETQKGFGDMLKTVYNSDKAITGYNLQRADFIWTKLYLNQLPEKTRQAVLEYAGLDPNKALPSESGKRFFDSFQAVRAIQHSMSAADIYEGKDIKFKRSLFTQETMVNTFLEEFMKDMTAHGASDDVVANTLLYTNDEFVSRLQKGLNMLKQDANLQTPAMDFLPGKQLFLAAKPLTAPSPFDFNFTPNRELHYLSGFGLQYEEALVTNFDERTTIKYESSSKKLLVDSMGGSIVHKNSLYKIKGAGIAKTTPEMRKAAMDINSDYALDELYYLVFEGYDKAGTLASLSKEVRFYRSQQEMMAQLNSNPVVAMLDQQGKAVPLDPTVYKDYIEAIQKQIGKIDLTKQKDYQTAELEPEIQTLDDIIKEAVQSERTGRVEEAMQTSDYKSLRRVYQMANLIKKEEKGEKGFNPEDIQYLYLKSYGYNDLDIAAHMASGEPYTLKYSTYDKIVNSIGFDEIQTQSKRLNHSTSDKSFGLSEFYYRNNKIIDPVMEYVNQTYGADTETSEMAFEYIMNYVQNQIAADFNYGKENSARPIIKRANELNYIEVNRDTLFSEAHKLFKVVNTPSDFYNASQYLHISFGEDNDYLKLISTLMNEKYHENIQSGTSEYRLKAYSVLNDFVKQLGNDKDFGQAIQENIKDISEYSRPEEMASAVIHTIADVKKKRPLAGIHTTERYTLPIDITKNGNELIKEKLKENPNYINSMIDEVSFNAPRFVKIFNDGTSAFTPNISKEYVRDSLFQSIFEDDDTIQEVFAHPYEYARKYGAGKEQAEYFNNLIKQTREDYTNIFSKMLSELGKIPGIRFYENPDDKKIYAAYEGYALNLTDKMPRFLANDGNVSILLGNMDLSLHGELLGDKKKYAPKNTRFTSNLQKAYEEGWFSWRQLRRNVINEGKNPLIELDRSFSRFGDAIRQTSTIDKENINNLRSNYTIGLDGLFKQILFAEKKGLLAHATVADHPIDPDISKTARRILDYNNDEVPDYPIYDATFKEIIGKNIFDVLEIVSGHSAFKREPGDRTPLDTIDQAVRLVSPWTGEKNAGNFLYGVGRQHTAFHSQARPNRITLGQNNFNFFSKHEALIRTANAYTGKDVSAKEAQALLEKKGIALSTSLHNLYTYSLEDLESLGMEMAYQVTGNKVLITDQAFHKLVNKQLEKAKLQTKYTSGDYNIKALETKLGQYSLLEDETIVNPRIYESIFNMREPLMFRKESVYQDELHKEINNLAATQFHLLKNKDGSYTFRYGEGIKKQAYDSLFYEKDRHNEKGNKVLGNYDGTLKLGFFEPKLKRLITENEINENIQGKNEHGINEYLKELSENAYFYLDPSNPEYYRKNYSVNVEKSKSYSNVFNIGEFDKALKKELKTYLSPDQQKRYLDRNDSTKDDIEAILRIIYNKTSNTSHLDPNIVNTIGKTLDARLNVDYDPVDTQKLLYTLDNIKVNFSAMHRSLSKKEKELLTYQPSYSHSQLKTLYNFIQKSQREIAMYDAHSYATNLKTDVMKRFGTEAMPFSSLSKNLQTKLSSVLHDTDILKKVKTTGEISRADIIEMLKLIKSNSSSLPPEVDKEAIYNWYEKQLNSHFESLGGFDITGMSQKHAQQILNYLTDNQVERFNKTNRLNTKQLDKLFAYVEHNRYLQTFDASQKNLNTVIKESEDYFKTHMDFKKSDPQTIKLLYDMLSDEDQKRFDAMPMISKADMKNFIAAAKSNNSKKAESIIENAQHTVEGYRKRLYDERFAVFEFAQDALLEDIRQKFDPGDILMITSENNPKHGDISKNMNETFLTLRSLRMRNNNESPEEATRKVVEFLSPYMSGVDKENLKEHGVLAIPDEYEVSEFNYRDLVKAIQEHPDYKEFYAPDNLNGIVLEEKEGTVLATLSVAELSNAKEYEYAGYSMPVENTPEMHRLNTAKQAKEDEIKKLKQDIKSLKTKINAGRIDPKTNKPVPLNADELKQTEDKIKELTEKISEHRDAVQNIKQEAKDYERAYKSKAKGMSFGRRETLSLSSEILDEDVFVALRKRMKDIDESEVFESAFNDVLDKEGKFIPQNNKPIFSAVLSHMSHQKQIETQYDELLNDKNATKLIGQHFKNKKMQASVKEFYDIIKKPNRPLSVESLERSYFLNRAGIAFNFNHNNYLSSDIIQSMEDMGFERISIDKLDLANSNDADIIEKVGYSPFSRNVLLDFGKDDFIAIPYLPHTVYKNDIVQKDYQSHWHNLLKAYHQLDNAKKNNDETAVEKAKKSIATQKANLKQALNNIAFGKDGVFTKDILNYRAPYSARVKASTAYSNYYGFKNAYFKGKSLDEWIDKKVFIDAAFGNEKMFRSMGLLNDNYLETLKDIDFYVYNPLTKSNELVSRAGETVTEAMLRRKLEREGVDTFSLRYPTNLKGSLVATKLYLDPNMSNNENRVRLAYWTQLAQNGDDDGDEAYFALALFRDAMKNQSYDTYHSKKFEQQFDKSILLRANSTNPIYASKAAEKVDKAYRELVNSRFQETYNKMALDGRFISNPTTNPYSNYTKKETSEMLDTITAIETEMGKPIDVWNLKSTNDYLAQKKELTKSIDGKTPELTMDAYNRLEKAVKFKSQKANAMLAAIAKIRGKGGAIGEIDNLSFELRSQADYLYKANKLTKEEYEGIDMISFLLTQSTISGKKSTDIDNVKNIQEFRDILNKAHNPSGRSPVVNLEEETRAFLKRNIPIDDVNIGESVIWALKKANGEEVTAQQAYDSAENAVIKMFHMLDNDTMRGHRRAIQLFTKSQPRDDIVADGKNAIKLNTLADGEPLDYTDYLYSIALDANPQVFKKLNENGIRFTNEALTGETYLTKDFTKQLEESATKMLVEDSETVFSKSFISKHLDGKTLAGAALGLAAAYMLTGFMGNSPSVPATTQSQQRSNEEQQQDQTPILSDYGTDYQYAQQDTGYVINVNADNGLKEEKTQKLIQTMATTLSHSINSDVNISMNIHENNKFDNYELKRLLTRTFGL